MPRNAFAASNPSSPPPSTMADARPGLLVEVAARTAAWMSSRSSMVR